MNRVIVIDIGNIQFKAIFAYRNNQSIPVAYTFLRMIIGYLKRLNATLDDKIIFAMDYGSWRKDLDKTYKAQRQEFRESKEEKSWWETRYAEFKDLYEKINVSLPFYQIKIYKREADDVISVCCRYYTKEEIIIVSSDKDLEQLAIYKNVRIFSPITKKFKDIKNPMKVLLDKIQGDKSDNLLDKPSSEAEFELRRKIVDLTNLPLEIERPIKEELDKIVPKNISLHKIPFRTVQEEIKKLYHLEDK